MLHIAQNLNKRSGFTLLEIIIVIIIIGVLASLALPRFFTTIEYSKAQEALTALGTLRGSMNRCYMWGSSYTGCALTALDVENPGGLTGATFTYTVSAAGSTFTIQAVRAAPVGTITINHLGQKSGAGIYANVK